MELETMQKMQTSDTLMILCPICGSDAGETLGVTGRMDGSLSSTVIMCCDDCGTVYLSPAPISRPGSLDVSAIDNVFAKPIQREKQNVPENTKYLCTSRTEQTDLERPPDADRFDLILMPLALESSSDPAASLRHIASLLEHRGRVDVMVSNTDSSCFRVFSGRHWFGYRFPHTRQLFGVSALVALAQSAGLRVKDKRTRLAPNGWLQSMKNWLSDWGARPAVVALFSGRWFVPWLIAAIVEAVATLRGRGCVLIVELEKE